MTYRIFIISIFLSLYMCSCYGQQADTVPVYNPARARLLAVGLGVTYAASMTGLYKLWYADYPSTGFHYFNDADEWKRMDKLGHMGSAYYLSRWSTNMVEWTGTSKRRSALIGTGISYLFLLNIEMFDAYSANWGFSVPDLIANTAGCGLFLSQQLGWQEQRITVKFSYHPSQFAKYRPDALGETDLERLFKDYNGQTYWLSFNIYDFFKGSKIPKWLNISAGYGVEGMVTAYDQVYEIDHIIFPEAGRYRQLYIGPDIDITKIRWKSGFFKVFSEAFGFVKFPLPAVVWNEGQGMKFLPVAF